MEVRQLKYVLLLRGINVGGKNKVSMSELKSYYMKDMPRTSVKTLITIYKTNMGHYKLKSTISKSETKVLYIYGEKELNCVKESARLFQQVHPNTILYEAKDYNHGYLSTYLPQEWVELVYPFLKNNN